MTQWKQHPSVVQDGDKLKLRIFEYFVVDKTLPKYLDENGNVSYNGKKISVMEYLKLPDSRSRYRRSYYGSSEEVKVKRKESQSLILKLLDYVFRNFKKEKKTEEKESVEDSFQKAKDFLKESKSPTELEKVQLKIHESIQKLIASGQYEISRKLQSQESVVANEILLIKHGYSSYMTEEDVIELFKKANFGLRLDFLEDYPEILPEEVAQVKMNVDKLKIFDNWCILHYDPKGSTLEQIKEIERHRDPILFGMVDGSGKIYKVIDWVFKDDDVTVNKICSVLGVKELRSMKYDINTTPYLDDIVESAEGIETDIPDSGV